MSLSAEIQSLYETVKAKFSEMPEAVHNFFTGAADKAKADEGAAEAAAQAEAAQEQAEVEHLISRGYTVVKAGIAQAAAAAPAVDPASNQAAAPVIGAPISVTTV